MKGKKIMKDNYLLTSDSAKRIYEKVRALPVVDYHCHLSPREIYEDKQFDNIGAMWLGGDHYKWRLMRNAGIDEYFITGSAADEEKFIKYCTALEYAAGNPLYHWSHMELSMYFGIDLPICQENAKKIWDAANAAIEKEHLSPRKLIKRSGVEVICTTDDICDDLSWHDRIASDNTCETRVIPSFRIDNLLLARRAGYAEYVAKLGKVSGIEIHGLETLKKAVETRLGVFCAHGCRFADVGIQYFPDRIASDAEAGETFVRLITGEKVTDGEYLGFVGNLYLYINGLYKKSNIISQWHIAVVRNTNTLLYKSLGNDCGVDCVGDPVSGNSLIAMLDAINTGYGLPKTIIYSLNEANLSQIASIAGAFPNVYCGAAWWFCDHKRGIEKQIEIIAENGCLGKFYGMLTDSRSFLSYARHDYFRRILSNIIGKWVEADEYNPEHAVKLASAICYDNIRKAVEDI